MQLNNLFPTPVAFFNYTGELTNELAYIANLEQRNNQGNTTSRDNYVLKDYHLQDLSVWIDSCINEYFMATASPRHKVALYTTQSWINFTKTGQYHHKHEHPNSIVSGVFYLQTNSDDRIYFYKSGYQQIKFATDNYNPYNSESWWYEAQAGKLILFPSSLTHQVPTVAETTTRISLSFNTFASGVIGENSELTELIVER
jgi:uncharacterized protein (TIGR02466 family)